MIFFTRLIADVAVTKRHQRLDEIRIFLPALHSKVVFKKLCHVIYAFDTLTHVTAYTCALIINACVSHNILLFVTRAYWQKKQLWFQYSAGKTYNDFILSLMVFPYSNMCYYKKVYLHEKSTYTSQNILLLAQYWVTKSIFSPAISQKPKTQVVFFLSVLTLDWRHSWKSAFARSNSVLINMRDINAHFDMKGEGLHRFGIILNVPAKVYFTKLCTGKSVLFEWLGLCKIFSLWGFKEFYLLFQFYCFANIDTQPLGRSIFFSELLPGLFFLSYFRV